MEDSLSQEDQVNMAIQLEDIINRVLKVDSPTVVEGGIT
jgi:hypothetical protein